MAERESMNHSSGLSDTEAVSGEECGNAGPLEMLDSYLKRAEECVEAVQKMPSPKFNNEQCEYLAHKLKVVVESASSFLEVSHGEHGFGSSMDMARRIEVFKLLLALAREIGSFIQGCGKDAWIQSAMTLTNVSEYVSLVGFNLELCRVTFCKDCAATGSLTLDQVDDINKIEVKIVEMKASMDVNTLFKKVILELNYLPSENRDLASYLLQRLARVQPIPSFISGASLCCINDDGDFFGGLFKRVQQTVRLGTCASGATVDKAMWLGTIVAKKTFYGPEDPGFMKEVEILGGLCHPNITSMFCSAMDRRRCSIIMELMDEDLHALMQRRLDEDSDSPPFTIFETVDIMLQIGEGVNYLHNKRIEHRDLKSFNILVKSVKVGESETGYVHVKVADFGLSKIKESSIRYSSQTFNTGTNRWMAPEIINLDNVGSQVSTSESKEVPKFSFKCDVYSFAMVCYEILTGDVPFPTIRNSTTVKRKVIEGDRPDLPYHCPLNLKALIEKCWNQVPRMRPSFEEICLELKHLKCLLMMGFNQDAHLTIKEGQDQSPSPSMPVPLPPFSTGNSILYNSAPVNSASSTPTMSSHLSSNDSMERSSSVESLVLEEYLQKGKLIGNGTLGNVEISSEVENQALSSKLNLFKDATLERDFLSVVENLLQEEGIPKGEEGDPNSWLQIVSKLALQAATYMKPNTSEGGVMDPGEYVKVKCIASGICAYSTVVKGVVCHKNVQHKRMKAFFKNPKLLLLGEALEYQPSRNQLSTLTGLLQEEIDYLGMIVRQIKALNFNVLLVEKSVAGLAHEMLLEKEISVLCNVKRPLLERIARCTEAHVISSLDNLRGVKAGQCEQFHIERFEEDLNAPGLDKKTFKYLTFFEGCPRPSGCTILLRGAGTEELKRVKKVVKLTVFHVYHLSLETSFLVDEGTISHPLSSSSLPLEPKRVQWRDGK